MSEQAGEPSQATQITPTGRQATSSREQHPHRILTRKTTTPSSARTPWRLLQTGRKTAQRGPRRILAAKTTGGFPPPRAQVVTSDEEQPTSSEESSAEGDEPQSEEVWLSSQHYDAIVAERTNCIVVPIREIVFPSKLDEDKHPAGLITLLALARAAPCSKCWLECANCHQTTDPTWQCRQCYMEGVTCSWQARMNCLSDFHHRLLTF